MPSVAANAGNYVLSAQPTVPNATITARPVHVDRHAGLRRDGARGGGQPDDLNKVSGDDLTLTGSADLAGKDVGTQAFLVNSATPVRVQSATGSTGSSAATTFGVTMDDHARLPATP